MKIILETERLFLREFVPSDGFHFFYLNNDSEVIKFTGNQPFKNLEEANNFILNYSEYNKYGFGRWAVCIKDTAEFIGWCGFKFDKVSSEIDLGFRFYKKYWGIGYATEAAKGCLQFGFSDLNFKEVVGRCYIENKASINVLEKCNFKFQKNILYDSKQAKLYTFKNDNNKKIKAEDTYPIRLEILRKDIPLPYEFNGDFDEDTFHLGAFKDEKLVAVSSFMKASNSNFKGTQYQLRGMATLIEYQGLGMGKLMLEDSFSILQELKIDCLWCNARVIAVNFYKKMGLQTFGEKFELKYVGDHYVMSKYLD